ncbi:MAG: hypothetical protein H6739_12515 [Alphaproteobacteria bacterium]|nr:hypothetical protein [Alphaproteobacteria bacterium]
MPDLQGGFDPERAARLQAIMGNSAVTGMMPGDPDTLFDAAEQSPSTSLPYQDRMEQSLGTGLGHIEVRQSEESEAALEGLNARSAWRDGLLLLRRDAKPEEVAHEVIHDGQANGQGESEGEDAGAQEVDGGEAQAAESEAHDKAKDVAAGEPVELEESPDAGIQRWGLGDLWDGAKDLASGATDLVVDGASRAWNAGTAAVSGTLDTVGAAAQGVWDTGAAAVSGVVDTGLTAASGLWDTVSTGAQGLWDTGAAAVGGMWDTASTFGQGLLDTGGAALQGLGDVWNARDQGIMGMLQAGGNGLLNTASTFGQGLLDTGGAALGGMWDTLKTGGQGIWDTLKAGGQGLWDTGAAALGGGLGVLDAAWGGLVKTGMNGLGGLYNTVDGLAPELTGWLNNWIMHGDAKPVTEDAHDRYYTTAPKSTVDNSFTGAMDIPGNTTKFTQQFSPMGIPLTDEAWERQNQIDDGKLQRLHHNTLLNTLGEAGILSDLVANGDITEEQATQDFSQMSDEDLKELVRTVDDAQATQDFFAAMDPKDYTNFQEAILDKYIEMANADPDGAAFFLDVLPTELDIKPSLTELAGTDQPNDFRAGQTTSMIREGSIRASQYFQDKERYGLVVPFSNTAENIVANDGVPVDGVDHLSNYLGKIDPNVTTFASGYSQSAAAVLHYAQQYGGTQGLDYASATAPMGGADTQGGTGMYAGTIRTGADDPGVQTLSLMHPDDPAQYIHTNDGNAKYHWSLLNFIGFTPHKVGDGELHGGFPNNASPDPNNGTNGYPMDAAVPYMEQLFGGQFQGQDYERRGDWRHDRRDGG